MNNIDILEEKEKKAIELLKQEPDFSLSYYARENAIDTVLNLIDNLIAENKELKEKNENNSEWITNLSKENDKLHRLITVHQEEKLSKSGIYKFNVNIEEDYISKSKVEELIGWIDEEGYWEFMSSRDLETMREKLQSLLGKE